MSTTMNTTGTKTITVRSNDFCPAEANVSVTFGKPTLQLELGKRYMLRDGSAVGPLIRNEGPFSETHPFGVEEHFWCWQSDGRYARVELPEVWNLDIVAEAPSESTDAFHPTKDLQDARARNVELEGELAVHGMILGEIADNLGLPKTDIIDTADIHKAIWELKEAKDDLQRRIVTEAEEAAQRIITLEDECKRLTELWHGAQVKVDVLESEKKNMIEAKGFIVAGPSDDLSEVNKLVCENARLRESIKHTEEYIQREHVAAWTKVQEVLPPLPPELRDCDTSLCDRVVYFLRERNELAAKLDAAKRESTNCIILNRIEEACRERDGWEQTAAQHLRNEQFYRDLLGQCAELLGDECRRSDDGKLIPRGDFLALKVPEVLRTKLEHVKMLTADYNTRTELGHSLFGADGPFHGALTIGQDVVLDGMKWMAREIGILRSVEDHKPFIRKLVATELGKATNNILKGL